MIHQIGQVMLYVENQEKARAFWVDKVGFHARAEFNENGLQWFEIAPTEQAQTSFVLHNKEVVAKMSPELNLGAPSIMFYVDNLDELYKNFKEKQITVGDIVHMPGGKVFNFADDEGNYFAVMEKS